MMRVRGDVKVFFVLILALYIISMGWGMAVKTWWIMDNYHHDIQKSER